MTSAQRGDVEMQTTVLISCVSGTVTRGGGKGKKNPNIFVDVINGSP